MEFNITLTTKDRFEAGNQWSKHILMKYRVLRMLKAIYLILTCIVIWGSMIISIIFLNGKGDGFVYLYLLTMICFGILMILSQKKLQQYYQKRVELFTTQVHRYIIDDDKIRSETECTVEETKIKSFTSYLESEQHYILVGPNFMYHFPKKEIEKLANKDEFYQWIEIMKKKLNSTSTRGAKTAGRDNRISRLCRKMFIEDTSNRSKNDTTNND